MELPYSSSSSLAVVRAKQEGRRTIPLKPFHLLAPRHLGQLRFVGLIAAEELLGHSPQRTQEPLMTLFLHTVKSSAEIE